MNNFGLGLILSFTDNATSGLRGASSAFNELSNSVTAFSSANGAEAALLQISAAAGIVGNELYNVGQSITALFTDVISSITTTGTTIMSARTQLSTLYGDAAAGQQVLNQIKDYAASSIFNFEDLIPSVIMLKANGIEAFDEIATSAYRASNGIEGTSQTLMDYAADLAAFNPNMRNAYGTGVQAAMGALNEYIAEGNAMSLKRGASLDILQLLGEEKGATIEERSRQVADLIEQLGMVGMTANLAGTPMQRLANVEDVFFNLMGEISDSGVFEKYSSLIEKFTDYLFSIPDEELSEMAHIIADALVEIMTPLEYVLDLGIEVVDWLRDLFKQNPEMAKMIIKGTALAGVFLLITGAGLRLLSALGTLRFSLSMLFGNSTLSTGARLLGLLKNLTLYILPVIAAVVLLKEAWDRDFMGMQERVKTFVKETIDTFKILFDAWGDYTLSEENFERARELGILPLVEAVLQLKYHLGFLMDGFKRGFDAFFDSLGNVLTRMGILDEETHGFRDLITKLLEKMTAPGMTDTWEQVGYLIGQAVGWILVALALLPVVIKAISTILGIVKALIRVVSVVKTIISWVLKVISLISRIGPLISGIVSHIQYGWYIFTSSILPALSSFFSTLGGYISSAVMWVLTGIGNIVTAILGAIGIVVSIPAWVVGLIAIAIAALVALVWHFRDEIAAFLVETWQKIEAFFQNLWSWFTNTPFGQAVVNIAKAIYNTIKNLIEGIITALMPIITAIIHIAQTIWGVLSRIVMSVWSVIKDIASIVWTIVSTIGAILGTLFQAIWSIVQHIWNLIKTIAESVWKIISSVANLIKNVFYAVYEVARVIVLAVIWVFQQLWDAIATGLSFVAKVFGWLYNSIISPVFEAIATGLSFVAEMFGEVFGWIYNGIISPIIEAIAIAFEWLNTNVFQPVGDFVSKVFEGIADVVHWLKDSVIEPVFDGIKTYICGAIQAVSDFVMPIIDAISEAISFVADGISSAIDAASSFIGGAGDFFSGIGDGLSEMVGLSTGGYVKTTGIAVLHPNEVVVNDSLTKSLGTFLEDYDMAKTTSSPLITQDVIATDDYEERDTDNPILPTPPVMDDNDDSGDNNSPMQTFINNTTTNNNSTINNGSTTNNNSTTNSNTTTNSSSTTNNNSRGDTNNDNSVTFEQGSIVFNIDKDTDLANMSDDELNAVADRLMRIMARKMQLRNMQTRK